MSDNLCYLCDSKEAAFICFCREVAVCRDCISQHLLNDPAPTHRPVPLARPELLQAQRAEIALSNRSTRSEYVPGLCLEKRKSMQAFLISALEKITTFETKAENTLSHLREVWEEAVQKITSELMNSVRGKTQKLKDEINQGIAELLDDNFHPPKEGSLLSMLEKVGGDYELLTLLMEIKSVDLSEVMRGAISMVIERKEETAGNPILYKFFGGSNQVGVFDAKSESFTRSISSNLKFYHNSCSCMASNGLIYLTGGSLTGRSRNDVICFNPGTGQASELRPMQISRRSHASICMGMVCYVFGGIVEEEFTSLCEKYTIEQDVWTSISRMNERRAYLGCCEYRNRVYLGGGAEQSSCEVFDPATNNFQLLAISHVGIEGNCSLMPLTDTILIFHGNFRGEVSRLWPATNQVAKEKDMCTGNSWSSCIPVLANNAIYMLRAESIFKFELGTSSSSYIIRMGKTGKRRFELE